MSEPDQSPLQFPCTFPIKAMGLATANFDAEVVAIVRRHAPDLAVTVTIHARSQAQLDAIYHDLVACEQVLMAL